MAGKGVPGVAPQTAKREQYAALIAKGVGNAEACRIVGINPRTGKRWRHGRKRAGRGGRVLHYAPVVGVARKREISGRFLSERERERIADLHRAGEGVRAIARDLGRSPATVSRELRRNVEAEAGVYRPHAAQRLAEQRRARPKVGKLVADVELRAFVEDKLKRRWSPEQIARALRVEFPDQPHRHLVLETIYQAVYRPELGGGLCRNLAKVLRTGRSRRLRRRRGEERRGRLVNMTMIDPRRLTTGRSPGTGRAT
jgi:IS30 family transposase